MDGGGDAYSEGLKPLALVCYLCGREFGTASLSIHQKTCIRKRTNEQKNLPAEQRIPRPDPPCGVEFPIPTTKSSAEEIGRYNEEAQRIYGSQMPQCHLCKRTFVDQATLAIHLKSCAKKHDGADMKNAGKGGKSNGPASNSGREGSKKSSSGGKSGLPKNRKKNKNAGFGDSDFEGESSLSASRQAARDGILDEEHGGGESSESAPTRAYLKRGEGKSALQKGGEGDSGTEAGGDSSGSDDDDSGDAAPPRDFLKRGGGKNAVVRRVLFL
jgi:hypothetical protein